MRSNPIKNLFSSNLPPVYKRVKLQYVILWQLHTHLFVWPYFIKLTKTELFTKEIHLQFYEDARVNTFKMFPTPWQKCRKEQQRFTTVWGLSRGCYYCVVFLQPSTLMLLPSGMFDHALGLFQTMEARDVIPCYKIRPQTYTSSFLLRAFFLSSLLLCPGDHCCGNRPRSVVSTQ